MFFRNIGIKKASCLHLISNDVEISYWGGLGDVLRRNSLRTDDRESSLLSSKPVPLKSAAEYYFMRVFQSIGDFDQAMSRHIYQENRLETVLDITYDNHTYQSNKSGVIGEAGKQQCSPFWLEGDWGILS